MLFLDKIAENRIQSALERGELDNLPGSGKPLALDNNTMVPAELRVAYRMLKNAGYLPPELAVRADIKQIEHALQRPLSAKEKKRLILKLSLLKSKLAANSGR